jgi:hypothetical protein
MGLVRTRFGVCTARPVPFVCARCLCGALPGLRPDTLGELRLARRRIKVDDRTAHERPFSLGDSDARRLPEPRAVSGSEQRCIPDAVVRPRKNRTVLFGRSWLCWLSRLSGLPAALRSWRPAAGSLHQRRLCLGTSGTTMH